MLLQSSSNPSKAKRFSDEILSVIPLEATPEYLYPPGLKSVQLIISWEGHTGLWLLLICLSSLLLGLVA